MCYKKLTVSFAILPIIFLSFFGCQEQPTAYFPVQYGNHGMFNDSIDRSLRYRPESNSFVIENGEKFYNRSLYGRNTSFRVAGGDKPEFFLFSGGKDGVLRLGLIKGERSKWLSATDHIITKYTPGKMLYLISDELLSGDTIYLEVIASYKSDEALFKIKTNRPSDVQLLLLFGGATNQKFFRNGDIGTEPLESYTLNAEDCIGNKFVINENTFELRNFAQHRIHKVKGILPNNSEIKLIDARIQQTPLSVWNSVKSDFPALAAIFKLDSVRIEFFSLEIPTSKTASTNKNLAEKFQKAELARKEIAERIKINTPDEFMNPLGATWAIAADACWEEPTWLHGAIGWRVRLNGWRAGYLGNVLGWHDRSRMHFDAYNKSQVVQPKPYPNKVIPGEIENLAREAKNTKSILYSNGYISAKPNGEFRMLHYDMNLVYIDALLWHLLWTGDIEYARKIWTVLQRHLDWEKRCFDPDDDGLYDAYCCIWASDALQYSGGDVTHSSSYNYRANKLTARIAEKLGYNPDPYQKEAEKILKALKNNLWISQKGIYAEFQDKLGNRIIHDNPAVWTIYHAIDNGIANEFDAYQMTRYIDIEIPHIPVKGANVPEGLSTISTSNWHPYTWSINNVAFAEVAHTCLAYWQAGRNEKAFNLWKSNIMDFMYMGSTPGNIGQISYYDAARGEVYSDFSDPAGIGARALIEGLFGIIPNALEDKLVIRPGFPSKWKHASISTPDLAYSYERKNQIEIFRLTNGNLKVSKVKLLIDAKKDAIKNILIDGKPSVWKNLENVGSPKIEISTDLSTTEKEIRIYWEGNDIVSDSDERNFQPGDKFSTSIKDIDIIKIYDPQQTLVKKSILNNSLMGTCGNVTGHHTVFLKVKQNSISWWFPLNININNALELVACKEQKPEQLAFKIKNNTRKTFRETIYIKTKRKAGTCKVVLPANNESKNIVLSKDFCFPGNNTVDIRINGEESLTGSLTNWNINLTEPIVTVDISSYFNDSVCNIYKNEYLTPRPKQVSLQLPKHGYGNWCHYDDHPIINDSGLRARAAENDTIKLENGLVFKTPASGYNVVYTSLWDNYPDSITISLSGTASNAYLLMTGSTNHMQSRIENGKIAVRYKDGSQTEMSLINPDNWWSIEQDMHINDYAFAINSGIPLRINLLTGNAYTVGKGIDVEKFIEGGAASVLNMELDSEKQLQSISIKTTANDVITGLMAVSLTLNPD